MKVLRSCLLLILVVATCHGFEIMRKLSANAPTLVEIRDDFVGGVGEAADNLQQAIVHKARATGGAVATLGSLNADLLRNFIANNYRFWSNVGNGVSTKSSQLWNYVSGGSDGSGMPGSGMPHPGMSGAGISGVGMPSSGASGSWLPSSGASGSWLPSFKRPSMSGSGASDSGAPSSGASSSSMPGSAMSSSWLSGLGKPHIFFPSSSLMAPGTGSGSMSTGSGSGSILPGTGSSSMLPGSGTGSISPSSKFENLRTKFAARPGCSLWESIKLPSPAISPRQAEENLSPRASEVIVEALESDEIEQNDEKQENDVTST